MTRFILLLIVLLLVVSCRVDYEPDLIISEKGDDLILKWNDNDWLTLDFEVCAWQVLKDRLKLEGAPYCFTTKKTEAIVRVDKKLQWYFRVQARDSHGNRSNWSSRKYFPPITRDPWHGYLHRKNGATTFAWSYNGSQTPTRFLFEAIYESDPETTYKFEFAGGDREAIIERPGLVGLYHFRLRACFSDMTCTGWAESTNPEVGMVTINEEQISGVFKLYWELSPPVWQ